MLDDSEYTAGELAGLNEWFQLHDELLPEEPFTFHIIKFKSGSPELIEFVMDPLGWMLGNEVTPRAARRYRGIADHDDPHPARSRVGGPAHVLHGRRGQHGQLRGRDEP